MDEETQNALIELENSLNELKSAVKIINETKGAATKTINKTAELIEKVKQQFENYDAIWKKHNVVVQELIKQHIELSEKTEELVKYLNSVNFPARLDKIDSTIATVLIGIQTIQNQLNSIRDEVNSSIKDLDKKISTETDILKKKLDKIEEDNNNRFIILLIAIGITIVVLVVAIFT